MQLAPPIEIWTFEGKYGAAVVTSGGGDEQPIAEFMNHFLITTGVVPVGSVWATMGTLVGDEFPVEIQEQALPLGAKVVSAWQNKERPAEVDQSMRAFSQRMAYLMRYRKDQWPYEYAYWVEHRGLK